MVYFALAKVGLEIPNSLCLLVSTKPFRFVLTYGNVVEQQWMTVCKNIEIQYKKIG